MSIVISDASRGSNPYLNRIRLVLGDITRQECDAIVSLLPQSLDCGGSLNAAIFERAGAALDDFVLEHIYRPRVLDVFALPGFDLPARNIIFAIRPLWKSDFEREDKHLVNCVRRSMVLARCMVLSTVAFPPLAAGKNGYGARRAARLLVQGILDRLDERIREVRIVCPDKETYAIYKERLEAKGWTGQ